MNEYTGRDKKNYGDTDIGKTAYPKFLEKLEVCRNLFYGFDYTGIFSDSQLALNKTISGGLNFMFDITRTDKRDMFIKEALMMTQAESLAKSLIRKEEQHEAAFFEAVRTLIVRITYAGNGRKFSLKEINEQINNLLKASIQSTGVINLFADKDSDFNLFDAAFLEEVSRMKEKNVAVELLKRLIADQVKIYRRTNIVQSQKFSERMQKTLNSYLNGLLTNEQVIEEMMQLAKEMAAAGQEGNKLGLSHEELAFYDALTKPAAIRDFYSNDELIAITRELAGQLRKNRTID
jgi:type I restriction enzyme, R subunit